MALKTGVVVLLIGLLTGCGPQIAPGDLPALNTVPTEQFLPGVSVQLDNLAAAVSDDPLNADKTGRLGMAYLAYRLDDAAEVALRRARLLQPQKFEWMYYHAEALTRLGRLREAADLLTEAIARKPGYAAARTHLGQLHMQLGELATAGSYLNAVVEDNPGNAEARLALAQLLLRADEPDNARTQLEFLVESAGPAGAVYFALADAWRRVGERDKAAENLALFEKYRGVGMPIDDPLMRAVAGLDLSERPLLRKARRLNQLGQTDEAIKVLHLALERNPHSHLTHAALVGAYGALKQFDKVDEHYRLAVESASPTAPLLRNLGRARFYEQRLAEARQALEQALELDPNDASALTWLGLVALQRQDTEQGLALLAAALEKNPNESLARHNLADRLRKLGRHAEALVHLKKSVEVEDSESPRVWRQMGESYLILGQSDEARAALTAAVVSAEKFNNDTEARRSAGLLRRIGQ